MLLPLALSADEKVDGVLGFFRVPGLRSPVWLLSGAGELLAERDWRDAFLPIADVVWREKLLSMLDGDVERYALGAGEEAPLNSEYSLGTTAALSGQVQPDSCVLLLKLASSATGKTHWVLSFSDDLSREFVLGILVRQQIYHERIVLHEDVESSAYVMDGFENPGLEIRQLSELVNFELPVGYEIQFAYAVYSKGGGQDDMWHFRAAGSVVPTELVGRLRIESQKMCRYIGQHMPTNMQLVTPAPVTLSPGSDSCHGDSNRAEAGQRVVAIEDCVSLMRPDLRFRSYRAQADETYLLLHIIGKTDGRTRWAYRASTELYSEETCGINYALHAKLLDESILLGN